MFTNPQKPISIENYDLLDINDFEDNLFKGEYCPQYYYNRKSLSGYLYEPLDFTTENNVELKITAIFNGLIYPSLSVVIKLPFKELNDYFFKTMVDTKYSNWNYFEYYFLYPFDIINLNDGYVKFYFSERPKLLFAMCNNDKEIYFKMYADFLNTKVVEVKIPTGGVAPNLCLTDFRLVKFENIPKIKHYNELGVVYYKDDNKEFIKRNPLDIGNPIDKPIDDIILEKLLLNTTKRISYE